MDRRTLACPHCKSTRAGLITVPAGYALRCSECTLTRPVVVPS